MFGGLRRLEKRRVTVHFKDESAIEGVLHAAYSDCVVLVDAGWVGENQKTGQKQLDPLPGENFIPRENVRWYEAVR